MQNEAMEEALREFAALLPHAVKEAVSAYEKSQRSSSTEEEIKKIKLQQDVGRAVMAHVKSIMKTADVVKDIGSGYDELESQIEKAEAEINEIREQRKSNE